jgi:hypothetical protein
MFAGCSSARMAAACSMKLRISAAVRSDAGSERRHAGTPRVGVVDLRAQSLAAQDQDEAVVADRLEEQLDPLDADRPQLVHEPPALIGADPTRAPVGDLAVCADRAKVAPRGDVVGRQIEVDAERLEHAAADAVAERIVAEEPEMTRPAAGRDPRRHGDRQPAHVAGHQRVQIGRRGSLEPGRPARRHGQAAQAVGNEQHDLRLVRLREVSDQIQHDRGPGAPHCSAHRGEIA